jgi:hypothetical protein
MRLPTWEQLSEALQRVMATGASERRAKREICEAIADGKIGLRLYFMMRPTRMDFLTGRNRPWREIRCIKGDDIPPILSPGDFDWQRSKVRKPELWLKTRGPSDSFFGNWRVIEMAHYNTPNALPYSLTPRRPFLAYQHRVELCRADITKFLCGGGMIHDEQVSAAPNLQSGGAIARSITDAIKDLWPDFRIPKGLSAKDRNNKIIEQLRRNGSSVSKSPERAIQRVLKTLKPK